MSGHSKWHNIRIRKGKQDAVRGKVFTRLAREIIVAARHGGGDPDMNPPLRLAIQKARQANMPADTVKRNVQRGTGELEGERLEEITYEGYGPAGVAVMIEVLTENRNRTVSDIRHVFAKYGGNMSESGSVSWQFRSQGVITVEQDKVAEEKLLEISMDAGADDLTTEDGSYEISTSPEDFHRIQTALESAGIPISNAELTFVPTNVVAVSEKDAPAVLKLMEALEDLDDVQRAYANFDIPEAIMTALE
jgi:YebC/PmpR family DNA-binding regulatory protein